MRNRFVLVSGVVAMVIMLFMLNFTTPTGVGPLGVLVFFTTLYVLFFGVLTLGFGIIKKIMKKGGTLGAKDYLYVAIVAFSPVVLLLVQGFRGFEASTVLLVALMVGLGCFLVYKKA